MTVALPSQVVVACLGDSLTLSGTGTELHSWPARLGVNLNLFPQCGIANFGKSGDQSTGFNTRYFAGIKGLGYSGMVLLGCINDVTNLVSAATSWANIQPIIDDWLATGKPLWLMSTSPAGSSTGFTAPMLVQQLALRANFAAKAALFPSQIFYFDLYTLMADPAAPANLNPAYSFGDGKHYNAAGGIFLENLLAPSLATKFPPATVVVPTTENVFGVDADMVRRQRFPQINKFSADSNPTSQAVAEFILQKAADLDAKLLTEGISSHTLTDANSTAYLWCQATVVLAVAVRALQGMTGQDPKLAEAWRSELKVRYDDLDEKGGVAIGMSSKEDQPEGPNSHISEYNLDAGDPMTDASDVIPPFRKSDEL